MPPAATKVAKAAAPEATPAVSQSQSTAKARTPTELLCAVAVGAIAFWAPAEDTGFLLRMMTAAIALGALVFAMIGLEMVLDYKKKSEAPKANPFEVVVRRVDVPTAPPGGVFAAACKMDELLQGFPVDIKSRVKTTEYGFEILSGAQKLKVRVLAGTAIGWEHGSTQWLAKRDEWIQAVQAAPRCEEVRKVEWMGIAAMAAAQSGSSDDGDPFEVGAVVKIDGLAAKPQLNGKHGVITKGINDTGRVGVRPEGQKDSLSLATAKLEPLPSFDRLGVSIPCLRAFMSALEPMLSGQTVHDAIDSVIRPLTMSPKCSVAQALKRQKAADEAGKPYAAPATVFFVYTDDALVSDLLAIIERYAASQPKVEDVYVCIDMLCTNQHAPPTSSLPMLWWQSSFRHGLKAIGSACLALHPWDEPPPLKRSWCLWQLHSALQLELPLAIETTAPEAERLAKKLVADMDAPMKLLDTRRDGWRSQAEAPTDAQRASVERAIDKASSSSSSSSSSGGGGGDLPGWEEFGRKLADVLHKWLLERAKKVLEDLPAEERGTSTLVDRVAKLLQDFGDLEAAEPLCREQVESRAKALGEHHSDTLDACNNLALLLHQLGKLEEAEPFSKRKLAGCRATLGDRHPDTITAIDTTSQLLSDLGKLEDALPLKRESLAEKRRTLGDRHPDTLLSVNNLAVLLNDLGRQVGDLKMLREAEPLKREALAGCREVLGNRHPHTLASVANLADLLMQLAPADPRAINEAEPLARESLAGTREVLGNGHPETLKSVGMLATMLVEQAHMHKPKSDERKAKFVEAEPLFREAIHGFTRGLGPYHPTPLSYSHELSRLLLDMGKKEESAKMCRETVKGCRASLGDSHPETLIAITSLGAVLRAQNQLEEAATLAREVRNGWMQLEGDAKVPRNTLTASNILAELLHSLGRNDEAEPLCRDVLNGFLRAVGPAHPFTLSSAENLSNVLRALAKHEEADKVLKQFGMKTPVGGAIMEEGDEEEEEDDEDGGKAHGAPQQPTGNGKANQANGGGGRPRGGESPTRAVMIDDCEDVD